MASISLNTQIFLAFCEYRAWGPPDPLSYISFRTGMLRHYGLIHLWLSKGLIHDQDD